MALYHRLNCDGIGLGGLLPLKKRLCQSQCACSSRGWCVFCNTGGLHRYIYCVKQVTHIQRETCASSDITNCLAQPVTLITYLPELFLLTLLLWLHHFTFYSGIIKCHLCYIKHIYDVQHVFMSYLILVRFISTLSCMH